MALQNFALKPVRDLLINTYFVPDYQREYSWGEAEIEELWNDILFTKENSDEHFFGQIVIHNAGSKKFIIDGQQRITTSMIILCIIKNILSEIYIEHRFDEANHRAVDIQSLCIGRHYEGKDEEFHLKLGNIDRIFFQKNILEKFTPAAKDSSPSHKRLTKAYQFFYNKIKEYIRDENYKKEHNKLVSLYDIIALKFIVMYIESTSENESFIIFETLNARGKDLETADLLKNFIFRNSQNDIEYVKEKWNTMINNLDKSKVTSYIRYFYNSQMKFSGARELYRRICKDLTTQHLCKSFIENLAELSPIYHALTAPEYNSVFKDDSLNQHLKHLKILGAKTFYPIILSAKYSNFSEKDISLILESIESLVFRNFSICRISANKSEKIFAAIAVEISSKNLLSSSEVCAAINKNIVDDDQFIESFKRFSGKPQGKDIIRYILVNIANSFQKETNIVQDFDKVHIEHIMPEKIGKWSISEEDHKAFLWRLGNLTLLGAKLNKRNSNKIFSAKKDIYKESDIYITRVISEYDDWGIEQIKQRQEELAQRAITIWKK